MRSFASLRMTEGEQGEHQTSMKIVIFDGA
jgi:hypothetical protein